MFYHEGHEGHEGREEEMGQQLSLTSRCPVVRGVHPLDPGSRAGAGVREKGLGSSRIKACPGLSPGCEEGLVKSGKTAESGMQVGITNRQRRDWSHLGPVFGMMAHEKAGKGLSHAETRSSLRIGKYFE
jgi:hypothetical protein